MKAKPIQVFRLFMGISTLAMLAALLTIFPTSAAAQSGGSSPSKAFPLAGEVNQGSLEPLEQHWYRFTPQGTDIEQTLYLVIAPDDGTRIKFVPLTVFEDSQIRFFSQDDTANMAVFGLGQLVALDGDRNTGERFWSGVVSEPTTYYIQIQNNSDFPIDYRLFNSTVIPEEPDELEIPEVPAEPEPTGQAALASSAATSNDPGLAEALAFDESGLTQGKIAPNSVFWYSFGYPPSGESNFKNLQYTMFFTPDDGNRKHRVNFELYPYNEFELWQRGDGDDFTNFGAGMLLDRDGDDLTGERLWSGTVIKGDQYLMSVANGNDIPIDYWLYEGDIINPSLGETPAPPPPAVFAPGAAPQTAKPLRIGVNKDRLQPGEESWYSFSIADLDDEGLEEMALTMIATPDDGNRIRNFTFDVFTAGGVRAWSPGDNSQINNLGAGSVVYRDNNQVTGERFWTGWVNDGDLYYVQVRNGTEVPVDYHLFTGDVYGPELGQQTRPVARRPAAPGKAPYAPVELEVGINDGRLRPGEEQWYSFSRSDVDGSGRVETIFTMVFRPDDGNRIRDVNFELFEGNALRDWAPDNRFNLVNFGQGSVVNRDEELETGELIWRGHVLAGDLYYMRVSNESNETIDYLILPEDVINTNLSQVR
jgi:hypothetical protein